MPLFKNKISYSKQNINLSDLKAIKKVLFSDFLTQGPEVEKFEKKINNYCKNKYSIACNSATSALHIACKAIGLKKNDIVWTNPISFVASANCALYCGAKVDYIDIDSEKFNITFENFKKKLYQAKKKRKIPKLIILVDYGGFPCDLDKIFKLAKKNKIYIIEDSSHAFGAKYKKKRIGNCKYSDITIFSFHPVKIITTGEGGIATTNNFEFFKKMQLYRNHGITRENKLFKKKKKQSWYYEQKILGFNYRMNDIEASLGISQLKRIKLNLNSRKKIAKNYFELLDKRISTIKFEKFVEGSYHLFPVIIDKKKTNISRDELMEFLKKKNIYCQLHYIPIFEHPFHKISGKKKFKLFPIAMKFYKNAMSLPMYFGLKQNEQKYIIKTINQKIIDANRNNNSKKG